ncbi:IDEAL domain-containing protein [Bacillus sp. JJ1122]|uniref:IDEAL domain-containing protein n=1 Tax=Bacillus sp. JJ1122 TaxID=3122951 RepID=UPI003000165A
MNNDKKSNYYKPEEHRGLFMDILETDDNTQHLLNQEKTRYTKGADEIIDKVQNAFLEKRRAEEIDRSLENRDKKRFMALTSEGWEEVL